MNLDVLIVGGGIAGNTAALSLCQQGLSVGLLDVHDWCPLPGQNYGSRVSSIGNQSSTYLHDLGAWQWALDFRACPFETIQAWDAHVEPGITFNAADSGRPHLGHIVENQVLIYAIENCLKSRPEFSRIRGELLEIIRTDTDIQAISSNGETISARLMIGADGAQSVVRRLFGIEQNELDYHQRGIVSRVTTELHHEHCARQVFLDTGPLAFLPLSDSSCTIVWSVPEQQAIQLEQLSETEFCNELANVFDYRLGNISTAEQPQSFPLKRRHVQSYIGERMVLIGDAAHTVHPLAGLGANQGIADVMELALTTEKILADSKSLHNRRHWRHYERARKASNQLTLATMDAFHYAFTSSNPVVGSLRKTGFRLVESQNWLKTLFIGEANG